MASHTLGTIRGTIEIDYDGAGIVKAVRDSDKASKAFERMGKSSNNVLSAFSKFARGATAVAGGIGTVYNVLNLVAGTLAVVGPLAAAAFAAAPAVVLSFASALVVLKVATAGVGDALAEAGEGGEKFEKAMAKLSPEAQRFVKAYQKALPALKAVQFAIQDTFFTGAAGRITGIVKAIGQLQGQAVGVAASMRDIALNVVDTVTSADGLNNLNSILGGVNDFLARIKTSIGPVVAAFIALGVQASTYGDLLGGKLANALASLADWLSRIDVAEVFARAMPILTALGELFSNVGSIVMDLFGMFNVDGASAVGVLGELVGQLAAFLKTAEGQEALTALGTAIQAIAGAAGQIFLALLQALAPTIIALAPGVAQLATQIASVLVPAITALNPLLVSLATFLSQNMGWIGPLLGVVVALAAAYKVYAVASGLVVAAKALELGATLRATAAYIAGTASIIAQRVAMVAMAVASGVVRGAIIAWTAVQWLLNAALTANPIGIVIVAIAALVAGIILLWKNSETFRTIVLAVWAAIKVAISAVASWITGTLVPSLIRAWGQIITGVNALKSAWNATWNAVKSFVMAIWNAIVSYVRAQINNVKSTIAGIKAVVGIIRNAFNQAVNAVKTALNNIRSAVKALPGQVLGALGNLGGLLYDKGVSLVQGFIRGIGSMIGRVRDVASSVVSAVTDFLPGSPAKEGPLSGRGYALLRARRMMADLARGIEDGSEGPARAMLGAVRPVTRVIAPTPSGGFSGGSTAAPTPRVEAGTREYVLQIDGNTITTLVVDAITGAPVEVKKAADEGTRRSAWAGSGRKG